jgi:phosphoglycolate phosphatase
VKYQLVIFDFDGTLADTMPWFIQGMAETTKRLGLRPIDADDLEMLRGLTGREIIKHLGIPMWKIPQMIGHVRQIITENVREMRLFPGVAELLRRLVKSGLVISIVSSNSEENVRAILGSDTAKLVTVYECGASLFGKAEKFKRVLKLTGFDRASALCVGDEIRDFEAAQKARIPFGAVSWGYTHRHALEAMGPAVLFTRPEQIDEWLSSP